MTQFKHIVQVHPVENGEPNLAKVKQEKEYPNKWYADRFIESFNAGSIKMKAVYRGCVDCATGELV